MNSTKVTIIIPVYKAELYIEKCLESLITQTLQEIEIICIDDCGKDNSINIVRQLAEQDLRIKIIVNQNNIGQSESRNKGIQIAQGEYIGFLDSDDWVEPNMFEIMYNEAKQQHADILSCNYIRHKKNKLYLSSRLNIPSFERAIFNELVPNKNIESLNVWTKIYASKLILDKQISFINTPVAEDFLFNIVCYQKAEKIVHINHFLYHYIYNQNSITAIKKYKSNLFESLLQYHLQFLTFISHVSYTPQDKLYTMLHQNFVRSVCFVLGKEVYVNRSIMKTWHKIHCIANHPDVKSAFSNFKSYPLEGTEGFFKKANRLFRFWVVKKISNNSKKFEIR